VAGLQKILIVEDNAPLRDMYVAFLHSHGYVLAEAGDGEAALSVAASFQPDLVFLDIMLPKLNGLEVLKKLRHDPQYNRTHAKIVLLTNLSIDNNATKDWDKDADGYVLKAEIVPTEIFEIIKSFDTTDAV
jgi:CheY-like chemotaxis protein